MILKIYLILALLALLILIRLLINFIRTTKNDDKTKDVLENIGNTTNTQPVHIIETTQTPKINKWYGKTIVKMTIYVLWFLIVLEGWII